MRVVCTADWHIHEFQDFSKQILVEWDHSSQGYIPDIRGKEMNSRLFFILSGICDIRDYCKSQGIHYVLHAGDVFHKRGSITVNAFNAAHRVIQTFSDFGIRLIIIAGNHDQVDASDTPETSIHTLEGNDVEIVESPLVTTLSSKDEIVSVLCMPYIRNKKVAMNQFHKLLQNIDSKQSILLMHCGITGGAVGSGMHLLTDDYSLNDLKCDKWKYVVLGHYHRPQLLSHNVFYCGTPVQNSFNDELPPEENGGYNGFFVIDTNKRYDIQFVPVYQPRFITVDSVDAVNNDTDYFRIKATSESAEELPDMGNNVRVEVEKNYKVDFRSSLSLSDTFEEATKKYYQENYDGDCPEVLELGLSILSKAKNELC